MFNILFLPSQNYKFSNRKCHRQLARWRKWRACDVCEAMEGLETELWHRWSDRKVGEWALLQPFCHFTYITTHSRTLLSLYLHHSSFSNLSIASLTSQLIFQPFFRFSYVKGSSLTSPGEPLMIYICIYLSNSGYVNLPKTIFSNYLLLNAQKL